MAGAPRESLSGPCRITTGIATLAADIVDPLIVQARATWSAGDFGRIAAGYARGAAAFVDRLGLAVGERVLDVACGTGNLSIPAARAGATVTGVDLAPNLVDTARRRARAVARAVAPGGTADGDLAIRFDVAPAEALPYPGASFDTVISMFGVMFAARPDQALGELLRVTRGGGRIALANWTRDGFVASMLRAHAALVPPPKEAPSPLAWGDEAVMRQRLEVHAGRIRAVQFVPRTLDLSFPLAPAGVVELFRQCYGPSIRTFNALDPQGRGRLGAELTRLWTEHNTAQEGTTSVTAEYMEIRIVVA